MTIDRIKPVVDVPIRVRLDVAAEGEYQSRSQWPDYKYVCNRGQAHLYLVEQGRQALIRSGARAGDDVEILKRMNGQAVSYEIRILTPGVPQAVVARVAEPVKPNGHAPALATPAVPAEADPKTERLELLLEKLLVASARSHCRAYQIAVKQGLQIDAPNWEDARCTATSLFIHLSEKGVV
jgi:hypothetical protein